MTAWVVRAADLNLHAIQTRANRAKAYAGERAGGVKSLPESVFDFFDQDVPALLAIAAAAQAGPESRPQSFQDKLDRDHAHLGGHDDREVLSSGTEPSSTPVSGDTCITCQQEIAADDPAEQDSPAAGRWHTRCAEQCPHCTNPYRHHRFVMPTVGGTEVCGHGWHDGVAPPQSPAVDCG